MPAKKRSAKKKLTEKQRLAEARRALNQTQQVLNKTQQVLEAELKKVSGGSLRKASGTFYTEYASDFKISEK